MQSDLFRPTSITVRVNAKCAADARHAARGAIENFTGLCRLEWFDSVNLHWLTMRCRNGVDITKAMPKVTSATISSISDADFDAIMATL